MNERSSYWQLQPFLKPQWPLFTRGFACILGYVLATLSLPYLAGRVAESIGQGEVSRVAYWIGIATIAFLIRGVFQFGENVLMMAAALNVTLELRLAVYEHLQGLGLDYFESARAGDITYRLTEEVDRVGEVIDKIAQQFLSCVLQLIVIPVYMFWLNWQLTLASLVLAPLMAWLIGQFGQRLLVLSRKSQNQISSLSSLLTEVFSSMRVVQAFAAGPYEVERFAREAERNRQARYRAERLKAIQYPVVGFLEAVSILLLFWLGGWQIANQNLTPTAFISYLAAVALLLHPIDLVTNHYNEFKQVEASVDRVFELLAARPALLEKPDAIALGPVTGKVEYREVDFAYGSGRPVLQHLSLLVSPGEVVALVGPSGSGKTTMMNLLLRFHDPSAGRLSIDGFDLRDVTLASLRRQIGLVPQDTLLFSGTIAGNIAYGRSEFDLPAIEKAARIANAHEFIERLPQGYHAWVGERGTNLSGGQRQRIAIARAILLDPRILILDEATSALDSESEALVREALERATRERTVFIIAHRLSTVRRADRILFLNEGRVVESGTHEELLALGGRYAGFYHRQFKS